MLAYWLLFLVFAAGALTFAPRTNFVAADGTRRAAPASRSPKSEWRHPMLFVAASLPVLMIGLRYEVGADWWPYVDMFRRISNRDFLGALAVSDPGYAAVNWLANAVGGGIWTVNLICGLLFIVGLIRFATVQPNPWLATAVAIPYLVIVVGMGYSRQAVAIGFCMAGLAAISNGSFGRFVFLVLIGAMFHRSAIIMLPVVTFAYSRNRFQSVLIGLVGCVVAYFVLAQGIEHFRRNYIDVIYEAQGAGFRLAMNVPPALLFLAMSRRFSSSDVERRIWRNFAVIAVASFAALLFVESTAALDRMALYIIPLQLFVLSRIPSVFFADRQSTPLVAGVLAYSALILFVWVNFSNNAASWLPYQIYPFE